MESKKISEISIIKTGKYDANHAVEDGQYKFFTCGINQLQSNTYSFDGELILLPGNGANLGEVFYHKGKAEAYQRTYVLSEIKCNVRFMYYFLKHKWYRHVKRREVGSATNYMKYNDIADLKIPLPPLPMQKKIVRVLDKARELIDLRGEQIRLLDELVQSVFYDMFGDPVGNPMGWEVRKLEEITTKITDGVHSKPDYTGEGVPFISVKDIGTGSLIFDDCKFISPDSHEKYIKRCKPEKGDILYTKVGARYGIPAIVDSDKEFSLYVSVALIKPRLEIIKSVYLREVMKIPFVYRQAVRSIKGIGVPDLHLKEIKKFLIPVPTIEEQNNFIRKIQKIEAQKSLMQQSLDEMKNNYNSLMQRAFKGELFS
ncbi:MAG: restriction endonuclease subunit S [Spirochaetales bacterium]|nr:restriction endonuclease subunit S [Spirochaetales bacterium]